MSGVQEMRASSPVRDNEGGTEDRILGGRERDLLYACKSTGLLGIFVFPPRLEDVWFQLDNRQSTVDPPEQSSRRACRM